MTRVLHLIRMLLAPAALVASAGLAFERAFDFPQLLNSILLAVVLGGLVGWLAGRRRELLPEVWSIVVPLVAIVVALGIGVSVLDGNIARLGTVTDALATFLLVGLPAPGLDSLSIVPFVVLFPAMVTTTWASVYRHTLTTIAVPVLAAAVAGLLVAPVGSSAWVPVVLGCLIAGVLIADVRSDVSSIPPLMGSGTELRRQFVWWRPLAQVFPALAAVAIVAITVPLPGTFDVRQFVDPDTVQVDDANPLAIAARWRELKSPLESARVTVDGESPGRMRVAVLDDYTATGWEQAAEYQVTGDQFAADPIYPDGRTDADLIDVTVQREVTAGFRALPSAGVPERTDDPLGLRYAPDAGVIYATDADRQVSYTTAAATPTAPAAAEPIVGEYPPGLATCPNSEALRLVSSQLTAGTVSAIGRLDLIEDWLLTRRIYDPTAPGGQTIGSVDQFLSRPLARGNLEVFVTTYALLARCAGVPVRVVVGYPEPVPGEHIYTQGDISAWVELPLAASGWVPFDPLPTPAEQQIQAQLPQQIPAEEPPATSPPSATRQVAPSEAPGDSFPWVPVLLLVLLLAAILTWIWLVPRLIAARRRTIADPTAAVLAAWQQVSDALVDRNVGLAAHHTPTEVERLGAGRLPVSVPGLIGGMAPIIDRARYSGRPIPDDEAALVWGHVDAMEERLPTTWGNRLVPVRHPFRQWRRLASTFGVARRGEAWRADLPDTMVISGSEAPEDVPDVSIDARIGDGATGTVYRGVLIPTGERVAVKVFRYGPTDPGFDENRFDWEVRIAREVSGLPHLPVVHEAGITPVSGRPYIVSSLYEDGTLLDRVRRGGPMTKAEAAAIGGDLAVALEALHQLGVIHADVKPENVFASAGGWVLGDLGSAWLRTGRGPAASLTPPYAAPEVWRGSSPTPQGDIYSLALTMLFAATGEVPIAGNAPSPDDVVAAFPDLPIVLRALDPDPRRRPRSVGEMGKALRPGFFSGVAGGRILTLSLPTPTVTRPRD